MQLTYPGVYTRELPSGSRSVAAAPTSVALFIGPTLSGIDNRPIRIQNFGDFTRAFGGLSPRSALSYSVLHFFTNGGGEAQVIRLPAVDASPARTTFARATGPEAALVLTALSSGAASNRIYIAFDRSGLEPGVGESADAKLFNLTVTDGVTGRSERFSRLSTAPGARFAPEVVNDPGTGSKLVRLTLPDAAVNQPAPAASGSSLAMATPPAGAGTFAKDVKLRLDLAVRAEDGTVDSANKIENLVIDVFAKDSPRPTSVLELATRLGQIVNSAVRANPGAKALLEGYSIEIRPADGNAALHVSISSPGDSPPARRIPEAVVRLRAPASLPNSAEALHGVYGLTETATLPARYRLGAAYSGNGTGVSGTPQPGNSGASHGQPATAAFVTALQDLATPDPFFNTLCLPDLVIAAEGDPNLPHHAAAMDAYAEAAALCRQKHAFLLVDPPPAVTSTGAAEAWKSLGFSFQSAHAAAFFPRLRVNDPLIAGATRDHPPSGAIAGLIARTDARAGVWQAPAGTDASLNGVIAPSVVLSDAEHGILNPLGLNVIRQFPIFGTVNFASRTVDGSNALASEWKYIPVRRTANHILRSLQEGLRWAVHKPNGEALWAELRVAVTAFMHGLYRQGAFKGASPREAYYVTCDASVNPADEVDLGVVNVAVGFAPLKPAEFVVISLRQIVQASGS